MIRRTLEELASIGYNVEDVIYVDDRDLHIDEIEMALPEVEFIHMWVDVKSFEELRELLERQGDEDGTAGR